MELATIRLPITPSMRLDGKRALVTGGGRGLGLAAGAALASAGASVVLVARSGDEVEETAAAIRGAGGNATAASLDLTAVEGIAAWIAREPAFDILVNNAGTNRPALLVDTAVADFDF